ncbi:protein of unknown function (plasmid) [Caballeronia sp. S22]
MLAVKWPKPETEAEVEPPEVEDELEFVVVAIAATETNESSAAAIRVRFMICIPYRINKIGFRYLLFELLARRLRISEPRCGEVRPPSPRA